MRLGSSSFASGPSRLTKYQLRRSMFNASESEIRRSLLISNSFMGILNAILFCTQIL